MSEEQREERLARARFWIRAEFGIAIFAVLTAGFLWVAQPGCLCAMYSEPPLMERLVPWIGVGGIVVGFVWMAWLARLNPERGDRTWRYRR